MTPAATLQRETARAKRDALELAMLQHLRAAGLTDGMVREHTFHDKRKWRFDFCWPAVKVALECDGGTQSGGRHTRGQGFADDCRKFAEAAILGWTVIRVTGDQVRSGQALDWVQRLVRL